MDQHAILHGLTEHGYVGIDNRSKVRHLLAGIKTQAFDTVKTRIISDAALRNDFDVCVNLFKDFITQCGANANARDAQVAALSGTREDWAQDINPDMSVEDRYIKTV